MMTYREQQAIMQKYNGTEVEAVLQKYKGQPGALIPALQDVQDILGYLPQDALQYVSISLNVPLSKVYGVVTFYNQFYMEPRGRNTIRVCLGTACHVKGAPRVLRKIQELLGISVGEVTDDLKFGLETVRCLGTCFLSPVVMVNRDYYGGVTPQRIAAILEQYRGEVDESVRAAE